MLEVFVSAGSAISALNVISSQALHAGSSDRRGRRETRRGTYLPTRCLASFSFSVQT